MQGNVRMRARISNNTILRRNPDQLYSVINGEVVMLSISNGEYYSLDHVGSHIWYLLEEPCTFKKLINDLLETYDVSESTCINDTKPFIIEFLNKGLIEITIE